MYKDGQGVAQDYTEAINDYKLMISKHYLSIFNPITNIIHLINQNFKHFLMD
ncbi:hypothetical protein NHP21005_02730 [Helicobacter sp. NHP21005]|nr:hypothetical protein NHP21005_02730 [Helicobacter sp. NHP21005]